MKNSIVILALACSFMSAEVYADSEGERCQQKEEAVQSATYGHIDAKGLKGLMDSMVPFVLLDARGDNWNDGTIIPGAMLAWYEDDNFDMQIPTKETLIVVYCYSFTCPLSRRLAQKLVSLGYENVIEYPSGLKEWRDVALYPVYFLD